MLNLFRLNGYSKKLRLIYIAMAFCRLREGLTDASTASVNPSLGDDDYLPHSLERDRLASVLLRRGRAVRGPVWPHPFHEAADLLRRLGRMSTPRRL